MDSETLYNSSYQSLLDYGISSEEADAASRIIAYVDPVRNRTQAEQDIITNVWAQLVPAIQQQADSQFAA